MLAPRTLAQEEFEGSPDLLFHGSVKPLNFSQALDYRSSEYSTENDGSTTLGFGFFTTDSKKAALNYSVVRQAGILSQVLAIPVLPYQARVLDLRNKDNLSRNAPVSREFATKWKDWFRCYLEIKTPARDNIGIFIDQMEREYAMYLERVLTLDEIDLRVLLETTHAPQIKSRNLPSPPWTLLFPDFMREEGYDGLVYIEGGEGEQKENSASYIFYNLSKIGTFESWKEKDNHPL